METSDVYHIIKKIYRRELEHYSNDKYVFYHAQSSDFSLLNYIWEISLMRAIKSQNHTDMMVNKIRIDPSSIINFKNEPFAVNRAIKLGMNLITTDDSVHGIGNRMFSVNYSIFGNYGPSMVGESSLHYFVNNYSQHSAHEYVDYIPYMTTDEKEFCRSVLKSIKSKQRNHYGRIISFIIPKDNVDLYVYNACPGGLMASVPIVSYFKPSTFDEINMSQARIIDYNTLNQDISVEIYQDDAFIMPYIMQIKNKLICNWI